MESVNIADSATHEVEVVDANVVASGHCSDNKTAAVVEAAEVTSTACDDMTLAQQIEKDEQNLAMRSQQYLQEIEDEVRQTQPLVSPKQDIATLIGSYDPVTSPEYFRKASELAETYSHIRCIRGDGNCFYRAVLTAVLEWCFQDKQELEKLTRICKEWRQKLFNFGFPELTTGDFCDAMDVLLASIADGTKTLNFLFDDLNADNIANYYVAFTRLICSGYLRENEELYAGFIEGGRTLDQYCKDEIEPMWRDCDHICIIALVNAIQVPIRIEYMDQSQAPNGGWHHEVLVNGQEHVEPQLFFLYRPGHYDVLYRKEK